jgi:hypothetical protein
MRKLLRALGIIVVVGIVAVAAGDRYMAHVGAEVDRDAQAYVDATVPAIVAEWSVDEMRREAAPALLQAVRPEDLSNLFALYGKLGRLVDYQGSHAGAWNVGAYTGTGKVVTAHVVAHATFAHGAATIDVVVLQVGGVWKIQRFAVNSAAMIENAVGRAI